MKNALSFVFILSIIFAQGQEKTRLSLEHYKNYEWTSNPTLSPDGEQILYSRTWINLVDDKRETDLWIMNKDGSTNRFFLKGSSGKWSPDGSKIAFVGSTFSKNFYNDRKMYIMDADGSNLKCETSNLDQTPSSPFWSSNSLGVYFNVREFGQSNVYHANLKGNVKKITKGNHMLSMNDMVGADAVGTWSDPSNPSDIVSFSTKKPNNINSGDL